MLKGSPILCGRSDQDQLDLIFRLCGTPTEETWPGWTSLSNGVEIIPSTYRRRIKEEFSSISSSAQDLLEKLLVCNPRDRIIAFHALDHDYFFTDPHPADPKDLPTYDASHEYNRHKPKNGHEITNNHDDPNIGNNSAQVHRKKDGKSRSRKRSRSPEISHNSRKPRIDNHRRTHHSLPNNPHNNAENPQR